MGKDPQIIAKKDLDKAELYYDAEQYKKAGKYFNSAGNEYFKLKEYKIARECFSYAAKSFENTGGSKFPVIEALRNAGDSSLFIDDFINANKFFKQTLRYIPSLRRDRDLYNILFSSLSFLCLFLEGKQEQGLTLLKDIRKDVESTFFKEAPLIELVTNLLISVRDKNEKYIDKIEDVFQIYDLTKAEIKLLKEVLLLGRSNIALKIELSTDKDQYTTRDIMKFSVKVDTKPLIKISQNAFYNYKIKKVKIFGIELALSENITAQKKPNLPVIIKLGENHTFDFSLKPHFQVENPFIGPVLINYEMDENFIFNYKTKEIINPNIISPPPLLDISFKNLRPPLLEQTFPMEFLIENNSEGDALELELNIEFPKELKVIRGTTKKKIYTLSSNDSITWELSLKPLVAGDHKIVVEIKFKDPDQNQIEDIKTFPFSIKL